MFKGYFSLIFIVLSLTLPVVHANNSQQIRKYPSFTRVNAKGALNVNLHTGNSHPRVILRGDPRDLAFVITHVVDNTLYVNLGKGYPHYGQVQVEIYSRYLSFFSYHGAGTVIGNHLTSNLLDVSLANKGKSSLNGHIVLHNLNVAAGYTQISGLNSRNLNIKISGKAKVQLSGFINVASLDMKDDGWLSLYWVKSDSLIVRGKDRAFIQLAGIVNRLDVELWGKACFNSRYLRAMHVFVKTHGYSLAEVSAIKHQHTLASDSSNIYFYNIPKMRADFMAFNGSVLDMREWNSYFMQQYSDYNK